MPSPAHVNRSSPIGLIALLTSTVANPFIGLIVKDGRITSGAIASNRAKLN